MSAKLSLTTGDTSLSLLNLTLGELTDQQESQWNSKTYLFSAHQKRQLTYSQLAQRSRHLARSLLSLGLRYGDRIGIFLPACVEHIELFLAAARIGLPIVSFNLTFTPVEFAEAATFTDCRAVFICPEIGPRSLKEHIGLLARTNIEHLVQVGCESTSGSKLISYAQFESISTNGPTDLKVAEALVGPASVINIQFTSGTTGRPKAAQITHYGALNNANVCRNAISAKPSDRFLQCTPLFHCMGNIGTFISSFISGGSIVFPSLGFDPAAALAAIIDLDATVIVGVPTMYLAIAEVAKKRSLSSRINSLRTGFVAGSPCSREILATMADVLRMQSPNIGYGITEMSMGVSMTSASDSDEKRVGTCGKALPNTTIKIVDKNDLTKILPRGQPGELLASGYGVFVGYYKQPEKTAEAIFIDSKGTRWLRTGDEAKIDGDGYLIITGRIKDIIIRGGENSKSNSTATRTVTDNQPSISSRDRGKASITSIGSGSLRCWSTGREIRRSSGRISATRA